MTPVVSDAEENFGLHLLYALRGPEPARANAVVVGIDSESAAALDLPLTPARWPRAIHAGLIDRLSADHVAVIAFDMVFHEAQDAANDETLATAIQHAGNVVLTQTIDRQTVPLAERGETPTTRMNIERVISAIPVIADAAAGQAPFPLPKVPIKLNQFWCFRPVAGNVPTLPVMVMHIWAKSAFIDFLTLLSSVAPDTTASLPATVDDATDIPTILRLITPLRYRFEEDPTLKQRMDAALERLPPDSPLYRSRSMVRRFVRLYAGGSSRYLNLYGPSKTIRTISYHRLIRDIGSKRADGNDALVPLEGAAVFVGQSGSNWIKPYDGFYTAFSGPSGMDIGGVEIAATAFANLIEDKAVTPMGPLAAVALAMVWGALAVLIGIRFSPVVAAIGLVAIGGLYLALAAVQFKHAGSWWPLVVPIGIQTPVAFITGLIYKYRKATIERRNIREAFGYYLPDPVVDRLSADMKELTLGGQVFYGICLFTDAQNYTSLSETMDPDGLTRLMNSYYETIFRPIKTNGGLVLQVVGDSVLAIWTASQPNAALKQSACRAAVEIAAEVASFNQNAGDLAMPTRVGIHAGEILLGNIGAIDHFEYRPVGDIVNTASRLEGLNKFLGTHLLVSDDAIAIDDGILARWVGRFVFKGKSQPVSVHELQPVNDRAPDSQSAMIRRFAEGLSAFGQRRWQEADDRFAKVLDIDADDGPARFYRQWCRKFKTIPPDEHWDGSIHLERK